MKRQIRNLFAGGIIKKMITVAALVFVSISCQKEEIIETDFYYAPVLSGKEMFYVRKDQVILLCESYDDAQNVCKNEVLINASPINFVFVVATIDPKKTKLKDLLKLPGVVDATYGLEHIRGGLIWPTNRIAVKIRAGQTPEKALEEAGLSKYVLSIEELDPDEMVYRITLDVKLGEILKTCRVLVELGLCDIATPTVIFEFKYV